MEQEVNDTTKVSREELIKLVNEALDGDDAPVKANAVIDKQAPATDLAQVEHQPHDRTEATAEFNKLIKAVPNASVPELFKGVKKAFDDVPEIAANEEDKVNQQNDNQVKSSEDNDKAHSVAEENIRREVRKVLDEAWRDPADVVADEEEGPEDAVDPKRQHAYKSTAMGGMHDVGGASFDDIAKEMGFSVAGAKQLCDKSLLKARALAELDDDELDIFVLTAMKKYVDYLNKSGELTPADVELLHSHPDELRGLDGFREFLDKEYRKARREGYFGDAGVEGNERDEED